MTIYVLVIHSYDVIWLIIHTRLTCRPTRLKGYVTISHYLTNSNHNCLFSHGILFPKIPRKSCVSIIITTTTVAIIIIIVIIVAIITVFIIIIYAVQALQMSMSPAQHIAST